MSRIAVDFDGTLIGKAWPEIAPWQRDAVWAMRELREHGHHPFLYTARLAPTWPDGTPRSFMDVDRDTRAVRQFLDSAGLNWMDIWSGEGKPHWDLLIDDKVLWYPGRPGSWKKIVPKVLLRVGDEDSYEAVMAEAARRSEEEDA